jgi:hypothetical protein
MKTPHAKTRRREARREERIMAFAVDGCDEQTGQEYEVLVHGVRSPEARLPHFADGSFAAPETAHNLQ